MTREARGTPATPFDVNMSVSNMMICWPNGMCTPAACATKIDARDRYTVVPSRLKLYPVGRTKPTMRRGTPSRSMFSIAFGNADSDEVVANAIVAGVFTARIKSRSGTRKISATGSSTKTRKKISAPYSVPTSMPRFLSTLRPEWPTVLAIAAPTPTGANFITNSVNRNMTLASDSHQTTIGFARSPTLVTASAKMTANTTICSTSPSAMALMIDAGERCAMISPTVWGFAATVRPRAAASAAFTFSETPTPGLVRFTAARPMNSANVVTISK